MSSRVPHPSPNHQSSESSSQHTDATELPSGVAPAGPQSSLSSAAVRRQRAENLQCRYGNRAALRLLQAERPLENYSGRAVQKLLNFIAHELGILKSDIATPEQNRRIRFDAAGTAEQMQNALKTFGSGKYPIHQWQTFLATLIETYITLYQLSRSATYGKEERPAPHGESQAYTDLNGAEATIKTYSPDKVEEYVKLNVDALAGVAVKLVDAVVATGALRPKNWKIAVQHWWTLLADRFPTLMSSPTFQAALKDQISIAEPRPEVLLGYHKGSSHSANTTKGLDSRGKKTGYSKKTKVEDPEPLTQRDKLIINLYEDARNNIRGIQDELVRNIKTGIRLKFADYDGIPDEDVWENLIKNLLISGKLSRSQFISWAGT